MSNRNDIVNELRELNSPLADMSRAMPYELPTGYFEEVANDVVSIAKVMDLQEPVLNVNKGMPYMIPSGYFEALPTTINELVGNGLPQKASNVYEVPAGYFAQLPAAITAKAKDANKPAKRISLGAPVWKQVRWAAAAVLILSIGIGSYQYTQNKEYKLRKELARVSSDSIHEYVQQHIDEYDTEMIADNMETNDLKTLSKNISEQEIVNYLNATGWEESAID
ncbi:MAG: hypothetical protein JST82_15845 [Bacteroidetes bacterium]|nr:hypothetical protein [Bacteroidota bacterium]